MLVAPRDMTLTCSIPLPAPVSLESERERRRQERRLRKSRLQQKDNSNGNGAVSSVPVLKQTVVNIKLKFEKGDDIAKKVLSFCALEDIPDSMQLSMLSCAQQLLINLRRSDGDFHHTAEALVETHKKAEEELGAQTAGEDDMLRLLDDGFPQFDRSACTASSLAWGEAYRSQTVFSKRLYSEEAGSVVAPEAGAVSTTTASPSEQQRPSISVDDVAFDVAYRSILNVGGEYARNLFHRERLDSLALGKAFKQMDVALMKLQKKQSVEMDQILHEMDQEKKDEERRATLKQQGDGQAQTDADGTDGKKKRQSNQTESKKGDNAVPVTSPTSGTHGNSAARGSTGGGAVPDHEDGDDEEAPMTVFQHQSNTDRISQLVNRHVSDTQTLEKRWMEEINKLKRKQKENYQQFIRSLYLNEIVGSGLVSRGHEKVGDGLFSDLFRESPRTSYPSFLYNPIRVKDTTVLPATNKVSTSQHKQFKDILAHETWLGSGQQKSCFNVRLTVGDIVELCTKSFSDKEFNINLACAENLYSNRLSAIVLPHNTSSLADIGGVGAAPRVKQFVKACERATEYHFLPFQAQMRNVKILAARQKNTTPSNQKNALKTGEFFLSHHSNLLSVHLVFHLIDSLANKSDNIAYEHGKVCSVIVSRVFVCVCVIFSLMGLSFLLSSFPHILVCVWCVNLYIYIYIYIYI